MSARRLLLFVLLGLIGLGVAVGLASVLLPWGMIPEEVIFTIITIGLYTLGALVAVTVARSMRRLLAVCLALAGVSCAGFVAGIWLGSVVNWSVTDWIFRVSGSLVFPLLAMVHRMVLGPMRSRSWWARAMLRAALISGPILAALLMVTLLWPRWYQYDEVLTRLIGVVAIVVSGSSVASGVIWFFDRRPEHDEPGLIGAGVPVELACPRCGATIRGRSNRECRCDGCRLKVRVEIEEPRCACGYLLYQLVGDTCPECGRGVAEEDRWLTEAEPVG